MDVSLDMFLDVSLDGSLGLSFGVFGVSFSAPLDANFNWLRGRNTCSGYTASAVATGARQPRIEDFGATISFGNAGDDDDDVALRRSSPRSIPRSM
jgi:hypothetical protein